MFKQKIYIIENDVFFQANSEKEIPGAPIRIRTVLDLLITSLNALPLSYRRPVGAKVMGQTSCILQGLECQCVACLQSLHSLNE